MNLATVLKKVIALSVVTLTAGYASAEEQFTVSGPLGINNLDITDGSFEAVVTYDSSVASSTTSSGTTTFVVWDGSVTSVAYRLFDSTGTAVMSGEIVNDTDNAINRTRTADADSAQGIEWQTVNAATDHGAKVQFTDTNKQLFISVSEYPDPAQLIGHEGAFQFFGTDVNPRDLQATGTITEVVAGVADTDGDGISDDMDKCPSSDLSGTIVVRGVDTHIPNTLQLDGCTLSDMLSGGSFRSKHIAHRAKWLKKHHLISGKEKGRIQKAAARSWKEERHGKHGKHGKHHDHDGHGEE